MIDRISRRHFATHRPAFRDIGAQVGRRLAVVTAVARGVPRGEAMAKSSLSPTSFSHIIGDPAEGADGMQLATCLAEVATETRLAAAESEPNIMGGDNQGKNKIVSGSTSVGSTSSMLLTLPLGGAA